MIGGTMTRGTCALTIGLVLLAAAPPGARAHHAFAAEFDARKPVHLVGVVTKVELINPHAWIHVEVKGPDGWPPRVRSTSTRATRATTR